MEGGLTVRSTVPAAGALDSWLRALLTRVPPRAGIALDRDVSGTTLPVVNPAAPDCRAWRPPRIPTPRMSNPLKQPIFRTRVMKRGAGE
jgi:hypothetical protein